MFICKLHYHMFVINDLFTYLYLNDLELLIIIIIYDRPS